MRTGGRRRRRRSPHHHHAAFGPRILRLHYVNREGRQPFVLHLHLEWLPSLQSMLPNGRSFGDFPVEDEGRSLEVTF